MKSPREPPTHTVEAITALDAAVTRFRRTLALPEVRAFIEGRLDPDVDQAHYRILRAVELASLEAPQETGVCEIAELVDLEVSTVSRHLDKITDAGLVTREWSDVDARRRVVCLTERGRQCLQDMTAARTDLWERLTAGSSDRDLTVTARVLNRIRDNVDLLD